MYGTRMMVASPLQSTTAGFDKCVSPPGLGIPKWRSQQRSYSQIHDLVRRRDADINGFSTSSANV